MQSFFLKIDTLTIGETITLTERDFPEWVHQITHVLRTKIGTRLYVLNNTGKRWKVQVIKIDKREITLEVLEQEEKKQTYQCMLWLPLIKLPKLEIALNMCTQLGVTEFRFLHSQYSTGEAYIHSANKQKRLQNIIREAAEQSEQFILPTINFESKAIKNIKFDTLETYVAIERFQDIEDVNPTVGNNVQLLVGPEGGWSQEEKQYFTSHKDVSALPLGISSILRTETAAVVGTYKLLHQIT